MRRIVREKHVMILASIENNLGEDKLYDLVIDKKILGFDLAFMTRRQLLPKYHEKKIKDQVKRQAAEDANIIDPKDLEDGFYECDKCGQKKTTFESRQLRSADEPATTFITCHLCRFTWKEN
jgi:transcription elongation factor S-II